ncbi:hypothetical protein AALP_AAs70435U000100 [Arabis alpina]|uniref:Nucleoplasmin-like domain-containing protein n=1 Tax=Arabis alpina TaxID=50452 RepID=A0A087FZC4_ARAAL|nr:hypothetical protein AALP_AAs70435U000100 [Arabis alpina]
MDDDWVLYVDSRTNQPLPRRSHERKFQITKVTVLLCESYNEIVVQYSIGGQIPVRLCAFEPGETKLSISMTHVIDSKGDPVEFSVTGDRTIRLTGVIIGEEKSARASELQSPNIPNNSMFRSGNIVHRVFERRIRNPSPGAYVNGRFYENILPSSTLHDVEGRPTDGQAFFKFTDDGQYIISFSKEEHSVIVYRASWCSYSSSLLGSSQASNFSSYATQLHSTKVGDEDLDELCADFFLHVPDHDYGIFATTYGQFGYHPDEWANLPNRDFRLSYSTRTSSCDRTTFYLISLCDGTVIDRLVLEYDFIELKCNKGAHLCNNILALTSPRNQMIMIYEIGLGGFTRKRNIKYTWVNEEQLFPDNYPRGRKCNPEAQLLDSNHVLIKFGSDTTGVVENLHAIYNMVTLEVVPFSEGQGSYEFFANFGEFVTLNVEDFSDISSSQTRHALNIAQLMSIRNNKKQFSRTVEHLLLEFPFECQIKTPSPYFEPSHFRFDDKMSCHYRPSYSPTYGQYQRPGWKDEYDDETAIFMSLKHPLKQKFTIRAGREHVEEHYPMAAASVLIHPHLPVMISFLNSNHRASTMVDSVMYSHVECINIHRR